MAKEHRECWSCSYKMGHDTRGLALQAYKDRAETAEAKYQALVEAVRDWAITHISEDAESGEEGYVLCVMCGDYQSDIEVDGEIQQREPEHDPECPLTALKEVSKP